MTDDSSLLLTLAESSQLVSHSHDPAETLANIVHLIQRRFHTAVCSVYLLEPERGELVLGATVGLKAESIGQVRMRLDEGLTGLVAEQLKPVMVADAFQHPRFKYFPEIGEDPYHSFLGVPLVDSGELQGVLVVQSVEPRTYRPSEVRMLVTVAAQLASLVGDAHLLEKVSAAAHGTGPVAAPADRPTRLAAARLSPGQGLGRAYVVDSVDQWRRGAVLKSTDAAAEKRRLSAALEQAHDELTRLSQRVSELVGEEHGSILQAQLLIMQDRTLAGDLQACLDDGASAEGALIAVLDKYVAAFQKLTTPFFRERVFDIKDVFYRVLWKLRPRDHADPAGERLVLVTREASVLELFAVDLDQLAAVVVEHGAPQSHAAILARSLGIPMVQHLGDFDALAQPGRRLLVDGTAGFVVLDAGAGDASDQPQALPVRAREIRPAQPAPAVPGLPRVEVNLNLLSEVEPALAQGAGGVGLYRSEFLFLARRTLPTEDEQVRLYRKLVTQLAGRPVSIRTFDLRPDKLASYAHPSASRPLDWRLVLDSQPLQQLFLEQVRAILRAATLGPVRILVPLVTHTELLDFVIRMVGEARAGLTREGLDQGTSVPLGVMIETAAAIPLVSTWAEHVAFFALGTNDLAASALGLDRDDPLGTTPLDPLHPGLFRLIAGVTTAAHQANRPVTVCGEMAADAAGAIALAALEIDALSVPVQQLAATRQVLAQVSAEQLIRLKPLLLQQRTATDIRRLLSQ